MMAFHPTPEQSTTMPKLAASVPALMVNTGLHR